MGVLLAEANDICLMNRGEVTTCFDCPKFEKECNNMKLLIVCSECGIIIGTKDGHGVTGVSHGICEYCMKRLNLKLQEG